MGRRILVAEDEYLVARHLVAMIRDMGGDPVGPVPDLEQARARAAADGPDAALLDIKLGKAAVFPLADEFLDQGLPIVFLSGYERSYLPDRFAATPLVEKPVKAVKLARMLASALPIGRPASG